MRKLKGLEERGSVAPVNFVVKVNKCSVITAVQLLLQEKKVVMRQEKGTSSPCVS